MTDDTENPDETAAQRAPSAVMMGMLRGFQVSQALYVVAELGIATVLEREGPTTSDELARRSGAHPEALWRLIRTLASHGVFALDGQRVSVTAVGATLSEAHPQSLHGLARMWMETHYLPFSELSHSVRTGRPGADHYLGRPFFDWLADDPDREALFSRAMADLAGSVRADVFDDYRLPSGRVVADIGGAEGSVLIELLTRDGDLGRSGTVFDRPATTSHAKRAVTAAGLTERIDVVPGDFFVAVPAADIYVLAFILHDWDDEDGRRILESIAGAAAPGARLVVIECVMPTGAERHLSKSVDLTMLGMLTGKERTVDEYRVLIESVGFSLDRVVPTSGPFSVLEATLVRGKHRTRPTTVAPRDSRGYGRRAARRRL